MTRYPAKENIVSKKIGNHGDLEVYQRSFDIAMRIFELSKSFPKEETYSLTDQIRRSSRSVCTNLAEAWRKRRYEKAFISKLSDCEGEAAETQVWLSFSFRCGYMQRDEAKELYEAYNQVIRTLVGMINHPETGSSAASTRRFMTNKSPMATNSKSDAQGHLVILSSCQVS